MASPQTVRDKRVEAAATPSQQMLIDDSPASGESSLKVENFMSKFRDKDTRALKNLNSSQFIEVWNNYDKDGEYQSSGAEQQVSAKARKRLSRVS